MRSNPNYDVIKEPRGFIKCLEVFLAIFAFACATGFSGELSILQKEVVTGTGNPKLHKGVFTLSYPFSDDITMVLQEDMNDTTTMAERTAPFGERSKTEFFVVIGVFCFLYSLCMIIYYVFFQEDNSSNASVSTMLSPPVIDFVFGAFWCLFWFFSSCAFASGVLAIESSADLSELVAEGGAFHPYCIPTKITCIVTNAKYATLTVAILLGFLNVFVWLGNIWFLWKETPWHNSNAQPAATIQPPPQQAPTAQAI